MVDPKAHLVESRRTQKLNYRPLRAYLKGDFCTFEYPIHPAGQLGKKSCFNNQNFAHKHTWLSTPDQKLKFIQRALGSTLLSDEQLKQACEKCLNANKIMLEQAAEETLQAFSISLFSPNYFTDPICAGTHEIQVTLNQGVCTGRSSCSLKFRGCRVGVASIDFKKEWD